MLASLWKRLIAALAHVIGIAPILGGICLLGQPALAKQTLTLWTFHAQV
jgi:hypothetical protein